MKLDLTDDERQPLNGCFSDAIGRDRYPHSPRIKMLKRILAKIRQTPSRRGYIYTIDRSQKKGHDRAVDAVDPLLAGQMALIYSL
jgi:hypothetical protein